MFDFLAMLADLVAKNEADKVSRTREQEGLVPAQLKINERWDDLVGASKWTNGYSVYPTFKKDVFTGARLAFWA